MEPVFPPAQLTSVITAAFADKDAAGSVTEAEAVVEHPLLSVTVTVYVPVVSEVAVDDVCSGTVDHEYVYEGVPPETEIAIEPFSPPWQLTLVTAPSTPARSCGLTTKVAGEPIIVVVHPATTIELSSKL